MNSNIDVYYPDIYCPAEEYEGVKYPGAVLGEYMISLNGCKDGYGASMFDGSGREQTMCIHRRPSQNSLTV